MPGVETTNRPHYEEWERLHNIGNELKLLDHEIREKPDKDMKKELRKKRNKVMQKIKYTRKRLEDILADLIPEGMRLSSIGADDLYDRLGETTALWCIASGLKISQIRNFLGHAKSIHSRGRVNSGQDFSPDDTVYLKILLVYAQARHSEIEPFALTCIRSLESIDQPGPLGYEDFGRFVKLIESIVAYHRYYGGIE